MLFRVGKLFNLTYLLRIFLFFCIFHSAFALEQLIIEPNAGRNPILNELSKAKSSIELVMYGITDKSFIDAIVKAKKAGKEVKIILEPRPYQSEDENRYALRRFKEANIELVEPNPDFRLTHQKTLIFDHARAMIMTFNLTQSTFKNQRNFALLTDNPAIVKEIDEVFKADSKHKLYPVKNDELIWSPNNSRQKILELIKQSQSTLKIYAQDITEYQIIGALAKASRAGKTVQLLLSEPNEKNRRKYDFLTRAGVKIHFSRFFKIHAKVIMVDDHKAMLGSINLTKSSLNDNRELAIITTQPEVVAQLINIFLKDFGFDRHSSHAALFRASF